MESHPPAFASQIMNMRLLQLLLAPLCALSFSMYTMHQLENNTVQVDLVDAATGKASVLAHIDGISSPFMGSLTVDKADGMIYLTDEHMIAALDITTGATKTRASVPAGGVLRHISYDYKGAAEGAPGHSLYGLWETDAHNISVVSIDKESLKLTPMGYLNVTGHVEVAFLGLPKEEPQWKEPEMKHYGVIVSPAGANPAPAKALAFLQVAGQFAMWGPLDMDVVSIAIDYDGGSEVPLLAHNVFTMSTAKSGGGLDFGITHMSGLNQVVYDHTARGVSSGTMMSAIDMQGATFHTVLRSQADSSFYLTSFDCVTGKQAGEVGLHVAPVAIYGDVQ